MIQTIGLACLFPVRPPSAGALALGGSDDWLFSFRKNSKEEQTTNGSEEPPRDHRQLPGPPASTGKHKIENI